MITIVPAILAGTEPELLAQTARAAQLGQLLSYDVADGEFVSSRTLSPEFFPKLAPGYSVIWHLMAHEPARLIDTCLTHATHSVVVHAEARGVQEAVEELQRKGISSGLALNPKTTVDEARPLLGRVRTAQVMTVYPGQQGAQFLPEQLGKLAELKSERPELVLAVDGGVSRATIEAVATYRPDYVLVGSALMTADDPIDEYRILTRLAAIQR